MTKIISLKNISYIANQKMIIDSVSLTLIGMKYSIEGTKWSWKDYFIKINVWINTTYIR